MKMLNELRARLHAAKEEGRAAVKELEELEAKDNPSDDDQKATEAVNAKIDDLQAETEKLTTDITDEEQRIARATSFAVDPVPAAETSAGDSTTVAQGVAGISLAVALAAAGVALTPSNAPAGHIDHGGYEMRLGAHITSNELDPALTGGFQSMADFAMAVRGSHPQIGGQVDERLTTMLQAAPANYHQEEGAVEGYMVPPAMRQAIWELIFMGDDILNRVTLEPTSSNAVKIILDETTPWGSTGIQARWDGEGDQLTADKLVTKGEMVDLHKLSAYVLATDELLEDAPRLSDRLTRGAARAINWKASDSIVYGNGVGQPMGYFNAACLVSVAKESGQAADTIVTANIGKMFSRLWTVSGGRPLWLANRDIVPQLIELVIGNQPVWTGFNAGLQQAPGGLLLGYPIMFSEHAKTLGDKGDLQLIDLDGYYGIQKSGGIRFASSIHLFFDYGVQAFRWTFRMGGQPFLSAAIASANGPNTKSHFVTLDARA